MKRFSDVTNPVLRATSCLRADAAFGGVRHGEGGNDAERPGGADGAPGLPGGGIGGTTPQASFRLGTRLPDALKLLLQPLG